MSNPIIKPRKGVQALVILKVRYKVRTDQTWPDYEYSDPYFDLVTITNPKAVSGLKVLDHFKSKNVLPEHYQVLQELVVPIGQLLTEQTVSDEKEEVE